MIRSFHHPVIFNSRSLRVYLITLRSPLAFRRLAWQIRKHPELALRAFNLELVRPGGAVPDIWLQDVPDDRVPAEGGRLTMRQFLEGR